MVWQCPLSSKWNWNNLSCTKHISIYLYYCGLGLISDLAQLLQPIQILFLLETCFAWFVERNPPPIWSKLFLITNALPPTRELHSWWEFKIDLPSRMPLLLIEVMFHLNWNLLFLNPFSCTPHRIYSRPPSWSRSQHVWLLIMRSRVRFPALPQILNVD